MKQIYLITAGMVAFTDSPDYGAGLKFNLKEMVLEF
jgi:hypothetical protein